MSSEKPVNALFDAYPNDARHMAGYVEYQRRYATNIRESDRIILELAAGLPAVELLDIGCSTGNLLRHLHHALPNLNLTGADLSEMQLEECRRDPTLSGITFAKMDIRDLPPDRFDLIVANAILYGFSDEGFRECVSSISRSLRGAGHLIAFDFFHPFAQEVEIVERSPSFPEGHPLHFRSYQRTQENLRAAGFGEIDFRPFRIPIKLPHPGYGSIVSYTAETTNGDKMLFSGTLFQPWCHLVAGKQA
jgi:cyclopropane fatty-acyl-phospholipid synthase-like methyltransferase